MTRSMTDLKGSAVFGCDWFVLVHFGRQKKSVIDKARTETTVGRLLANMICLYEAFGTKLPYINKKFTVSTIESIVAPKLNSNPIDDNYDPNLIYVRDLS